MTEIAERLPIELANMIYSYLGVHPVAQIIEDKINEEMISEFCVECRMYLAGEDTRLENTWIGRDWNCYDGKCEYCYAEELGEEVYTCAECCDKTYTYGKHNNTGGGLFCDGCMENRDEDGVPLEDQ
jgi:hypothetical protein